jgi:hypothetical protein
VPGAGAGAVGVVAVESPPHAAVTSVSAQTRAKLSFM